MLNLICVDLSHDKHPYQADQIRGVDNGMLMCETHAEVRKQRDKEWREGIVGREGRNENRSDEERTVIIIAES